ncbi:tRNA adenosine(34) deaminase TadA [Bacterioplanes sanyensis]|uniref:tRNA-specific adenosine deaminase n=2 Tax=Bacterioplanes sanyensis TaxID=1249553 RepID=A0A222FR63_9GAMM|nr:tRNA adenosine(34) deaminase TadA [Bacterioplanes sanyensis]
MQDHTSAPVCDNNSDERFMRAALQQARQAFDAGEVPVGAVVVQNDVIIGRGFNQPITTMDPSAHAEMQALRDAARNIGNYRLRGATLYVTVEPCTMCTGLLIHSRIHRLVYGTHEPKAGAVASALQLLQQPCYNHQIEVKGGVLADDCSTVMSEFFQLRREAKKRLKQR